MKNWILILGMILTGCQSQSLKKESTNKILVHGHRGSRGTHPENTIPAFQEALNASADVLELDLHLTKDNVLVVSHDARLPDTLCRPQKKKQKNLPVPYIRSLSLKEVKSYDCGSLKNTNFSEQIPLPGTQIPTFDEVLDWVTSHSEKVEFNVETKMDAENKTLNPDPVFFTKSVVTSLKKYNVLHRTLLQSFDFSTLIAAKKLEPSLRLAALFEFEKEFCAETQRLGIQIASPFHELLTQEQVEKCHKAGIQIVPWTLNEEALWDKAIAFRVDGIITDYPRKLVTFLKKHEKK